MDSERVPTPSVPSTTSRPSYLRRHQGIPAAVAGSTGHVKAGEPKGAHIRYECLSSAPQIGAATGSVAGSAPELAGSLESGAGKLSAATLDGRAPRDITPRLLHRQEVRSTSPFSPLLCWGVLGKPGRSPSRRGAKGNKCRMREPAVGGIRSLSSRISARRWGAASTQPNKSSDGDDRRHVPFRRGPTVTPRLDRHTRLTNSRWPTTPDARRRTRGHQSNEQGP